MSQTTAPDHFALVEKLKRRQPTEYTALFAHPTLFAEYGYRSTGTPGFKWYWYVNRLLTEDNATLLRLLELCD